VLVFVAGGVYLWLSCLNRAMRKVIVALNQNELVLRSTGLLAVPARRFELSRIADAEPYGHRFVEITLTCGRHSRFCLDRTRVDLIWLIAIIRAAAGLKPLSDRVCELPVKTKVIVQRDADHTVVLLPPDREAFAAILFPMVMVFVLALLFLSRALRPHVGDDRAALWAFTALLLVVPVAIIVAMYRKQRTPSRIEFSAISLQASGRRFIGGFARSWVRSEIEDVMSGPGGIRLMRKDGKRFGWIVIAQGGTIADRRWLAEAIRHEMRLWDLPHNP
jgi:hypothetical protein